MESIEDFAKEMKTWAMATDPKKWTSRFRSKSPQSSTKIYYRDTYNNNSWARNIEGDAEHQQQQHIPDEIIDTTHTTITKNIHASGSEGGTVSNRQT